MGPAQSWMEHRIYSRTARTGHEGRIQLHPTPIYTSLLVLYIAVALGLYGVRNVILIVIAMFWFVLQSFVKERFLREDPQYAAYMQRVRARWIPFVV